MRRQLTRLQTRESWGRRGIRALLARIAGRACAFSMDGVRVQGQAWRSRNPPAIAGLVGRTSATSRDRWTGACPESHPLRGSFLLLKRLFVRMHGRQPAARRTTASTARATDPCCCACRPSDRVSDIFRRLEPACVIPLRQTPRRGQQRLYTDAAPAEIDAQPSPQRCRVEVTFAEFTAAPQRGLVRVQVRMHLADGGSWSDKAICCHFLIDEDTQVSMMLANRAWWYQECPLWSCPRSPVWAERIIRSISAEGPAASRFSLFVNSPRQPVWSGGSRPRPSGGGSLILASAQGGTRWTRVLRGWLFGLPSE